MSLSKMPLTDTMKHDSIVISAFKNALKDKLLNGENRWMIPLCRFLNQLLLFGGFSCAIWPYCYTLPGGTTSSVRFTLP